MSATNDAQGQPRTRVLLVEDDPEQAQLVRRWLDSAGLYRTVHAATGLEGEALVRGGEWDIVVSDIQLPGISGLELLRISKEVLPYTPTLLMTAHESMEYALDAIRGRADDFLVKPLRREPFLGKVAELVAKGTAEKRRHRRSVLAVGAHPDDVEIGCGGILLRHRAAGDSVAVLTLSGGEQGGTARERVREAERAAAILGARLFMGALQDASIPEGMETISLIEDTIRETQPTIIYTHTLQDGHQDHRSVHRATIVAARAIPSLYCYQAPSSGIDFRPTKFMEMGEFLEGKLEAIRAYGSQVAKRPYLRESLLRATAEYWGRFAGYGLVEPLEVVRESA
jgi:LmbE family N-acetylglucosaminyl deacetylase/ActR/RegA family two-component response regulator